MARRLAGLLSLTLVASAFLADAAAAKVTVDSITPAIADRGALITITGQGFGAKNVKIKVDDRTAEVVSATGNKATFRVPALAGPGRTTVKATNPGGHSGTIGLHVRFDGVSTPILDAPRRVSATIGRAGGTLGSGGLTLTIPAGALSEDTTIALTPLMDLADSPLAATVIKGAKLEPEGLRFLRPAVLSFALPAGVPTADVIGFGSAGDGSELHLQPHGIAGGTISLQLWHFSTAGGSSGGAAAAAAFQRPISNAERRAKQRIAAAFRACNAEAAQGIFNGPACADVRPESIRALFDWYTSAVRPGLQAAANAPSFTAEASLAEWLAWQAEVQEVFRHDPPGTPQCGTLQSECDAARALATTAVQEHAQRRLDNCTGTSLASQFRDVARMADFAGAGAIDITGPPLNLPDAISGALLRECAHLEITVGQTDFPAIAALNVANTLRGRVTVDVHVGPDRTDVPFTLTVDGNLVSTATDGTFQTTLTPTSPGQPLDVKLEAEATNPSLQNTAFSDLEDLVKPTRERLLLRAQGPTAIPLGGSVSLSILVAGDGMAGSNVALSGGGLGSLSSNSVTTNSQGEAAALYTAESSGPLQPNVIVIARLPDGTTATLPITIQQVAITVSISPTSATLPAGSSQNFTATVTNGVNGVTWSRTGGGAVVATGPNTARYDAGPLTGTFTVTATSVDDPTKSASANVTIIAPPPNPVRILSRVSVNDATCNGVVNGEASACDSKTETSQQLTPFSSVRSNAFQTTLPDFPGFTAAASASMHQDSSIVAGNGAPDLLSFVFRAGGSASAQVSAPDPTWGRADSAGTSRFTVGFEVTGGAVAFEIDGNLALSGDGCARVGLRRQSGVGVFGFDYCVGDSQVPSLQAAGSLPPGLYTWDVRLSTSAHWEADGSDPPFSRGIANGTGRLNIDLRLTR